MVTSKTREKVFTTKGMVGRTLMTVELHLRRGPAPKNQVEAYHQFLRDLINKHEGGVDSTEI